jgi:paraquat-inducible protein B
MLVGLDETWQRQNTFLNKMLDHDMPNSPRTAAARKIQSAYRKHYYTKKYGTDPRNELVQLNRRIAELRGKINELSFRLMAQALTLSKNNKNKLVNNRKKVRAELNNLTAKRPAVVRKLSNYIRRPGAQTTIARRWRGVRARARLANPNTPEGREYIMRQMMLNTPIVTRRAMPAYRREVGRAIRANTPAIQGPQRPTLRERAHMNLATALRGAGLCRTCHNHS